jgi:hypothetical protein
VCRVISLSAGPGIARQRAAPRAGRE